MDTRRPVALVTGAGPGSLGEATAGGLRERGFRVLTTTRSCEVGADTHPLELTDRASVDATARWVGGTTRRLDVLVNNAGVHLDLRSVWREPQLVDGEEVHWRTNYLGTAQLTHELLPLLLETAHDEGGARVVNVVSKLHDRGSNDGLDGHLADYDSWVAYGTSKLALIHLTTELERRYGPEGLHAFCLHPGSVRTRIADRGLETSPVLARLRRLAAPLERRALATPVAGSRTSVLCATSPDVVPGAYYRSGDVAEPSPDARDDEAARLLWEQTQRWLGHA